VLFISNFVLEFLTNICLMKKSLIVFIVAGLVLMTTGLWFFTSFENFNKMDLLHFGVITLIVGFAVFVGLKRLRSEKRGEPVEDELSKKILQKTAAISYYISLYIWVFLIFLKDRVKFETEELLGTGILAMAVTFGIAWLILNFKGIKND
jgi:peptidoglycan/LPS O-acetylase OafA/YrhL